MKPRIGALFAGYAGLDLAVQSVYGGDLAWYSEIDKGALKVLNHRFPDVPNVGDVTAVDWSQVEPVDILTGGSPCQDLSHAGRRAGMTEGTRSNLWVAMREAIAQLRPSLVVWENVRGAASAEATSSLEFCPGCMGDPRHRGTSLRALGRVVGDLSDLGYVGQVRGLRAADVGAPHGRFRYFLAATDAERGGRHGWAPDSVGRPVGRASAAGGGEGALLPTPSCSDTNGAGPHGEGGLDLRTAVTLMPTPRATDGSSGDLMLPSAVAMLPTPQARDYKGFGPADGERHDPNLSAISLLLPTPAVNDMGEGKTVERWDEWTADMQAKHGNGNGHGKSLAIEAQRLLPTPSVQLAHGSQTHRSGARTDELLLDGIAAHDRWGDYAPAIARWADLTGRPAPEPTQASKKGTPQLSPRFVEWMMGLPAGWVTDAPGITRNEALKALGNGVVPQQAAEALRVMASWQVAA